MLKAIEAMTGDAPSRTLEDLVPDIEAPLLLISAGTRDERDANVLFERAATAPAEHLNLPLAGHTAGIRDAPAAYEEKVIGFLGDALLGDR
jgi:hypothetical protein